MFELCLLCTLTTEKVTQITCVVTPLVTTPVITEPPLCLSPKNFEASPKVIEIELTYDR